MSCHICSRTPNSRLPFYCPTCARNQLYELRIENAGILFKKENIGQQIENTVSSGKSARSMKDLFGEPREIKDRKSNHWTIRALANRQAESSARAKALTDHVGDLQFEIKNKKLDISQRKAKLSQRYSDAESAKFQLAEREAAVLTGIQNNAKRTEHLWNALHNKTAEARIFLCREAANLYGLRQEIEKKNGVLKESYVIGGVHIIDLRDMNGATPSQISTSLSNVAHLLVLVSHYLSLRLPAEIILPHRNHPTSTIYTPAASYLNHETYLGASYSQSSPSSPAASRTTDSRSNPHRVRPLFIDKNLPKLAKEDQGNYALFLEGATLLAWNVSWLCRTQGIGLMSDSWEEVCDLGKSMWQLLATPPAQTSTSMRAFAGRDSQSKTKAFRESPKTTIQRTKSFPMLGHYSHGTVHSFLGASEGTEYMRTWKLPTSTKVMDKLRTTLLGEMASAEWEFLEDKEWDDQIHDSTQTGSKRPSVATGSTTVSDLGTGESDLDNTASAGTVRPEGSHSGTNDLRDAIRPRGTSGWTKVKSREKRA